jgi:pSer/pThr/pTyr-binding forkhead associated (FHA) protein
MADILHFLDKSITNRITINKPVFLIGRMPTADFLIEDRSVSSEHAAIEFVDNTAAGGGKEYHIRDLDSKNSTYVNGKKVTRQKLNNNDIIRIGTNKLQFVDEP